MIVLHSFLLYLFLSISLFPTPLTSLIGLWEYLFYIFPWIIILIATYDSFAVSIESVTQKNKPELGDLVI